ncbi:dinucleotide-utilizing enzyme possibly involved in molybdopterin or thiamin biosynthesis [Galbibacter orientalis DSM 19592]|uniref:Dinucleotide-utilizing enzyme possibly involved in molybdopterin or thiamin biosynthesis n=1 Tax=Galbibacter orientalis DSM 19592 TaxID=926559 RepID=I3C4Y7_9FLAO|nr:ThiF family adenylyltransferase [Galbibacter orientalis]EIJ38680.1 dinucleotide-utilizing enzyme possibly involved in molybdopterin or thiamin biosynthesis [Galbibacter orientalis DSM 19592]
METFLWHEKEALKNLYESEIDILKRGLKGDFKLFKLFDPATTDGRIVAVGELSFGNNQKQDLQIIFPTKYPFAPPKLISVNTQRDNDGNLIEGIQPKHFNKGNQYNDASLCLFEKELWNKEEHNIAWTLRRAQKWLVRANSPEGFSKEEIIEEYPAIMPHLGQVLLPKSIELPKGSNSGQFVLTQFKPNHYILEQNVLSKTPFTLSINKEVFNWFAFDKKLTQKELLSNINAQAFINILSKYFGVNLADLETKNLAFYLPAEENPWYFFKFNLQQVNGQLIISNPIYYISRTISNELYLRSKDIFDDKILINKNVTIIGVGAIGSEVAKSLAKNGVGNFNLFDIDTFEIGNSIRHAADLYYIGEKKVEVVKQLILRSNPNISVNAYHQDVLNDNGLLESALSKSDLCIVLTAEDSVDYLINDNYIKNFNYPFVFARASTGAFSGAIQVVDSDSACLRCLSLEGIDVLPQPKSKVNFSELKREYGSCSSPALPGSEIDTKEIALQVARVAIQCLMHNESSNYPKLAHKLLFWHGPYGSKNRKPFTWEMKNHEKSKSCKLCNP